MQWNDLPKLQLSWPQYHFSTFHFRFALSLWLWCPTYELTLLNGQYSMYVSRSIYRCVSQKTMDVRLLLCFYPQYKYSSLMPHDATRRSSADLGIEIFSRRTEDDDVPQFSPLSRPVSRSSSKSTEEEEAEWGSRGKRDEWGKGKLSDSCPPGQLNQARNCQSYLTFRFQSSQTLQETDWKSRSW